MKMDHSMLHEEIIQEETVEIEETIVKKSRLLRRQTLLQKSKKFCAKEERSASIKKVSLILQKSETDRSLDDNLVLRQCSDVVDEVQERWRKRDEAKRRLEEYEDSEDVLHQKCQILAQAIAQSRHLVVYTGAGISTAAKIPDYRGPNGIWTRLKEGKDIGDHDLSLAEPTFTHMALFELYRRNILKYVVSQNCDGLHLRSGIPRSVLSELHGNMYVEVCRNCKPHKEYWRLFDVTENTARFSHKTYRRCYTCNEPLVDSIVHFGERGSLQWPLNWKGACKNARDATTILCLGSSLKVLKRYPWLWQMEKPAKKRPNLYIVNLQWTPKDDCANVKLNGKCDVIMKKIMDILGIVVPRYDKTRDPIFAHATHLTELERHTNTQSFLACDIKKSVKREEKYAETFEEDCTSPLDLSLSINNKSCDIETASEKTNDYANNCHSLVEKDSSYSPTHASKDCPSLEKSTDYICHDDSDDAIKNSNHAFDVEKTDTEFNFNDFVSSKKRYAYGTGDITSKYPRKSNNLKNSFFNNLGSQSAAALSLLSYNFLHQQMLNSYTDFFLYPYQTSFLYSGLHSIINPLPVLSEDLLPPKIEFPTLKVKPSCAFCDANYNSLTCVFYPKYEPVFSKQQFRYSKIEKREKPNSCVCCDYTTDEDDYNENYSSNVPSQDSNNICGCATSSSSNVPSSTSSSNVPSSTSSSNEQRVSNDDPDARCSNSNVPCACSNDIISLNEPSSLNDSSTTNRGSGSDLPVSDNNGCNCSSSNLISNSSNFVGSSNVYVCKCRVGEEKDAFSNCNNGRGKVQAGWFGKGYKKGRRSKRKAVS